MIAKLLAWPVILLGIVWALKPQSLRGALTRKANWKVFWLAAGVLLLPLLHLGSSRGLLGIAVILIIFGMIVSQVYAAVGEAFMKVPLVCFQVLGVVNIVGGVWILRLH
jgi:hypothetical protein